MNTNGTPNEKFTFSDKEKVEKFQKRIKNSTKNS